MRRKWICFISAFFLSVMTLSEALAYQPGTLYYGCRGQDVQKMQQALIDLGFLGGTADGKFGLNTENAVRKFQKKYKLGSDGLAGAKTLNLLYSLESGSNTQQSVEQASGNDSAQNNASIQSAGVFGGNYTTIKAGSGSARVKTLQSVLITVGYLKDKADGVFGSKTKAAVIAFQKAKGLTADGLAGKKTLTALEKALSNKESKPGTDETVSNATGNNSLQSGSESAQAQSSTTVNTQVGHVKLLHWFNDIKPQLKTGQIFTVVDPSSGISWKLKLYSAGRHADSEPLTAEDTANMVKAFGNINTWSQKAVYVQLPNGTWTVGSTHDMPHLSGSVKDNNFDGHLCLHFLRDMDEAKKNDPEYGVSNQETIRAFWKSITGETVN